MKFMEAKDLEAEDLFRYQGEVFQVESLTVFPGKQVLVHTRCDKTLKLSQKEIVELMPRQKGS